MITKILFIAHYHSLYGANKSLLELIDGLTKFAIHPFVILPTKGDLEKELNQRNVEYRILPVPLWVAAFDFSPFYKISIVWQLLGAMKSYVKIVEEWDIDLVYTNSSVTPIGRLIAILTKRPHIWHIRELLDLHYSYKFVFPESLSKKLIQTSSSVICITNAVRNHYFNIENNEINVIHDSIASIEIFDELRIKGMGKKNSTIFTFCIIGQIFSKKGQDTAIKALSKIINRGVSGKLIIAGDGSKGYVDYCKNLVRQLDLEQDVTFTGFINDPYEIYFSSDCLLMCSEYEAMGRVTVEAMSACLPVIAKNSGGTPEIVAHKQSGFLYENFDELVLYMIKLITEPELAIEFGIKGWEIAKERFNTESYAHEIFSVIKSIQE